MGSPRVEWVDTAKGICIIFVVMMHSVLGVEAEAGQTGWMHAVVTFAKPFRMPDFFLISGLFLSNVINRDWKLYLDRKVVHFLYFYLLWLILQFAVKTPGFVANEGWDYVVYNFALSFVEPFGTLWFIYMLPIFFVVCKLAHDKGIPWQVMLGIGIVLQVAPIQTGWGLLNEFTDRFVFFYAGYIFAPRIFALADWASARVSSSLMLLFGWALVNGGLVAAGWAELPVVSLVLGAAGAMAIILTSALIAKSGTFGFLRNFGQNSIVIYLAFFFPMAVTRIILMKLGYFDIGTVSALVTAAAVTSPMILLWMIERTNMGWFLFRRPEWAYLDGTRIRPRSFQPAE
ncbi:acyltransferase family protein [Roseibium sp.]|uniref:acyltransferase family protein n=1 Tax=Roseibium sp. TaxID=1936156 RepID=UPI003A97D009